MVKGFRKFKKLCGIYCIENKINHKRYIGQSKHIFKRWINHRGLLRDNKHENDHLQRAYNQYGVRNFMYYILELCEESDLDEKEISWISKFHADTKCYGYNFTKGGQGAILGETGLARRKARKRVGPPQSAKMSEQQAKEIVEMIIRGKSNKEIERETGIKYYVISSIRGKRSWRYLTNGISFPKSKMSPRSLSLCNSHTDESKILKIIEMLKDGYTNSYIARNMKVEGGLVSNIRMHKQWTYATDKIVFPEPTRGDDIYNRRKYTAEEMKKAVNLILSGESIISTSKITGISVPLLKKVRNKKAWTDITKGITFPKYKLPSSGYYGVHNKGNRWIANIQHRGKIRRLGSFTSAITAAIAYDRAAIKEFGHDYAKINFKMAI